MIKLVDLLNEGVYDPGIFKAVFTGGGPGSGKSFAASELFGIPEKMPFVSAKGLKGVNTDSAFEASLKRAGLGTDLSKMDADQFAQSQVLRKKAKKAVASLQKRGAKDFTKVIKMTKNQKNGAYSFKQEIVHKDQVNDYLAKK